MEGAFLDRWSEFARWSFDNLKGAVSVVMLRDSERPNIFISAGPWTDAEYMMQWRQSAAFAEAFRDLRSLCEKIEPHTMKGVFSLGR